MSGLHDCCGDSEWIGSEIPVYDLAMRPRDNFEEFEATTLFCPRCRRATPTRKKLLLVLPSGNKYDYVCAECGTAVGGKTDNDPRDFFGTAPPRSNR